MCWVIHLYYIVDVYLSPIASCHVSWADSDSRNVSQCILIYVRRIEDLSYIYTHVHIVCFFFLFVIFLDFVTIIVNAWLLSRLCTHAVYRVVAFDWIHLPLKILLWKIFFKKDFLSFSAFFFRFSFLFVSSGLMAAISRPMAFFSDFPRHFWSSSEIGYTS